MATLSGVKSRLLVFISCNTFVVLIHYRKQSHEELQSSSSTWLECDDTIILGRHVSKARMMSSSPRSRTTRTKRACDGCQIRKVKCDGNQPCLSCANTKIACTFSRTVHTRGPRRIREATRNIIERQQSVIDDGNLVLENDPAEIMSIRHPTWKRTPVGTLAPQLYIYHLKMFPVWPIVNVDNLIVELQQGDQDSHDNLEAYALATSIVAATVAQLSLDQKDGEYTCILRASDMVYECEKACNLIRYKSRLNLNTIRILFFLHIYHENQQPGCAESLLYLRESISVAQLMSLHQEKSYTGRDTEEQNLRRWILWLLFVTERGVCLLHKMPVIIKTNITLPTMTWHGSQSVLPAFVQLINLFWTFEQARLFNVIVDGDNTDLSSVVRATAILDSQTVETLHQKLYEVAKEQVPISDVQKVDIYVTRHWMRMILWKLCSPSPSSRNDVSVAFPLSAASDFLNTVTRLPTSAIEAHGLTIQLKIVEIASSVVDSISHLATLPLALPNWTNDLSASRVLTHLDTLMSSFRHNAAKGLIDLLCQKTAEVHARTGYCPPLSHRSLLDNTSNHGQNPLEEDDHKSNRGQNLLFLPTFDDALAYTEASLVLGSANDVPHGSSDQNHDDIRSVEINSPSGIPMATFDQYIGQDVICLSQQICDSGLNPAISLPVGNNEGIVSTVSPYTPDHYELSSDTRGQTLF